MTVGPQIVIPILSVCGLLLVIIIVVLIYLWCRACRSRRARHGRHTLYRGFTRRRSFEIASLPVPGVYRSPLFVQLEPSFDESCDVLVDVSYVPTIGETAASGVQLLGSDSHYGEHFLLYKESFAFTEPGRYVIHAHTVYPSLRVVGAVHQFTYDVTNASSVEGGSGTDQTVTLHVHRGAADMEKPSPPLPPRIIPETGEVTTFTPISIAPHEASATADQIRYSVDGSHPSLLYTGPFTLSVPPLRGKRGGAERVSVCVRALTVGGTAQTVSSSIAEATLDVYAAGHTFFDPMIPSPVGRVVAKGAELYFDEAKRPPNTHILYQMVFIGEARQKAKFSRRRGTLYEGRPVPLEEDVAFVYAWTFLDGSHAYDASGSHHVRSSAAVYDCGNADTWHRGPRDVGDGARESHSLPPPVMCVRCKEMELFFEDPPAGGIICYTLNNTEPCKPDAATTSAHMAAIGFNGATRIQQERKEAEAQLDTFIYKDNRPICVTLLKTEQVFLTARTFIPISDPAAGGAVTGYRFGERFYRGFFSNL